jgi:hypothetical protein
LAIELIDDKIGLAKGNGSIGFGTNSAKVVWAVFDYRIGSTVLVEVWIGGGEEMTRHEELLR